MGRGDIREVAVSIYTFFGGGVLGFSIKRRLGFGSGLVGGAGGVGDLGGDGGAWDLGRMAVWVVLVTLMTCCFQVPFSGLFTVVCVVLVVFLRFVVFASSGGAF
ncbi:Hypothetical predicted protein [Olea europaea subsp. europaea]|uniref:Uncharacterized protein n=1 Tax=Olea europaea subsp. europaea TaxID=158383 RepID=A0A8S0RZK6_OLEEU|nr:Hypothetical predicted protein [Olea europaea subsp. europaea]